LSLVLVGSQDGLSSVYRSEHCRVQEVEILDSLWVRADCAVVPVVIREGMVLLRLVDVCKMS
jgi:hypothetical protein